MHTRLHEIENRFTKARPSDATLGFYTLDWVGDLTTAQARAKKEQRPVFFIFITNISAATSFFTGHC